MHSKKWIASFCDQVPRTKLYCFCYAGGNANYFRTWRDQLRADIEICAIQLPGRGVRFKEAPYQSIADLVPELAKVILTNQGDVPFVFFGHSLGGLVAFELARYIKNARQRMPSQLIISGCHAARYRRQPKGIHLFPDDQLKEQLRKYGGTPPELLAHDELMQFVLPTIRADFAMVEEYVYELGEPLNIPIHTFIGKEESYDHPNQIEGWREETTAESSVSWFEGGHFFIQTDTSRVIEKINNLM